MLKSNTRNNGSKKKHRYGRLVSIGMASKNIIDELSSPIDAANRFINLALNDVSEGSQSRQFLLESKQGIKKTAILLKTLNVYVKKMEKEIGEISGRRQQGQRINSKQ